MKKIYPTIKRKTFRESLPSAPAVALDLIMRLMTYDPKERLDAQQAMTHPFLVDLYTPLLDQEIKESQPIKYFDFEFENYTLTKEIIRELILDEIILSNSSQA